MRAASLIPVLIIPALMFLALPPPQAPSRRPRTHPPPPHPTRPTGPSWKPRLGSPTATTTALSKPNNAPTPPVNRQNNWPPAPKPAPHQTIPDPPPGTRDNQTSAPSRWPRRQAPNPDPASVDRRKTSPHPLYLKKKRRPPKKRINFDNPQT